MSQTTSRFRGTRGQTSTETVLIIGLVAIALLLVVTFYGQKISRLYTSGTASLDAGKPITSAKSDLSAAAAPAPGLDGAGAGAGNGAASDPGGGTNASGGKGGTGGSGDNGAGGGSGGNGPGNASVDDGLPPPAPSSVLGTTAYYRWRYDDYLRRHPNGPPPPDYYLNYGEKYALRFTNELRPKMSEEGKAWLDRARMNLQTAIEKERAKDPAAFAELEEDNDAFRKFAYDTHADSYWNAGLADLPITDLIKIGLTPDLKDLFTKAGLGQVVDIAARLAVEYAKRTGQKVEELVDGAIDKGKEVLRDFKEGLKEAWRDLWR